MRKAHVVCLLPCLQWKILGDYQCVRLLLTPIGAKLRAQIIFFQRLKDGGVHQHQGGRGERRPRADDLGQPRPVLLHRARVLRGPRQHLEVPLPVSAEWRRWAECVAWQSCDALRDIQTCDTWHVTGARLHMMTGPRDKRHGQTMNVRDRPASAFEESIWSWLKWKLGMSSWGNLYVTISDG